MSADKKKNDDGNRIATGISLITQFGIYMLVPIAGMSAIGYFLDRHFETNWIIIVCFFVGAVAGGQNVYKLAMKVAGRKAPEKERKIINRRTDAEKNNNCYDTASEETKSDTAGAADGNSLSRDNLSDTGNDILQ